MATNYKKEADIHFAARLKLQADNERLRAVLEQIVESDGRFDTVLDIAKAALEQNVPDRDH